MMKLFAVLMVVPVVCVLLTGAAIYRSGILIVDVQNKVSGRRMYLPVPMMLVNLAATMNARSAHKFHPNMARLQNINVQSVFAAFADCPDATFVEVEKEGTNLVIAKEGRNLSIHAESEKETVDIRVPIKSAEKAFAKLTAQF